MNPGFDASAVLQDKLTGCSAQRQSLVHPSHKQASAAYCELVSVSPAGDISTSCLNDWLCRRAWLRLQMASASGYKVTSKLRRPSISFIFANATHHLHKGGHIIHSTQKGDPAVPEGVVLCHLSMQGKCDLRSCRTSAWCPNSNVHRASAGVK